MSKLAEGRRGSKDVHFISGLMTERVPMEDLRRYLEEFVEPTIADFEKDPASVRRAFLACVATFHSVDYLAHPRKPQQLRQKWKRAAKAFTVVHDLPHASN